MYYSIITRADLRRLIQKHRKLWASAATFLIALFLAGQVRLSATGPDDQNADVEMLVRAGHWKHARDILQSRLKARPQNARDCYLLAKVDVAFKDFAGALSLAQRAVALDGGVSDYHLELGEIDGEMATQASMFSAASLVLKFRKEVETAIQLDPRNLEALDTKMQFKYRAPIVMGGDKAEARALAARIMGLDRTEGYLARAELAELGDNPAEEESDLRQAVQANPKRYGAQTELAKFYAQSGHANYQQAIEHACQAVQLDPTRAEAYSILARAYVLAERWTELDQTLDTVEKQIPGDLGPFYAAAQAMLDADKDLRKAEQYAKKYLTQEPEGEEPDTAQAHRLLGLLLEKQGRRAEARSQIQFALQIGPDYKEAKNDRKRLAG